MIAQRVQALLGERVSDVRGVGGGCICPAYRVTLAGGGVVFAKSHPSPPPGFFEAEARGLRWLADARAVAVPDVVAVAVDLIVLTWVEPGRMTRLGAERLGTALAALHASGSPTFGAASDGYIGSLVLPNTAAADWPTFYAEQRIRPYVRAAVERGALDAADATPFERLCDRVADVAGPAELPARLHGDLWGGNVLWGADGQGWLVDPAAHGGHRETDLAMLALFGLPDPRLLDAYQEATPLADGWRERVALHQLHPLLVHAVLFGGGYGRQAVEIAHRYVSSPLERKRK